MAIKGKTRPDSVGFEKKIGIAEFRLVAINPTLEEIKKFYPNNTSEKEPNYVFEKADDEGSYTIANIVLYLKDQDDVINKTNILTNSRFWKSKEGKYQFINSVGNTLWAKDEEDIKVMLNSSSISDGYKTYIASFIKRPYRKALNGEGDLYDFLQKFTKLDTRDPEAELIYNTKKWFNGDFSELQKDLITPAFKDNTIVSIYEITSKKVEAHPDESTGEILPESWKFYQGIYNKFLPGSYISSFAPGKKYSKYVQSWVDQLTGANGSKNFFAKRVNDKYVIELAREYVESENPVLAQTSIHGEGETTGEQDGHIGIDDLPF